MNKILMILVLAMCILPAAATTYIYDTDNLPDQKIIQVDSDLCLPMIECNHQLYINDVFVRTIVNKELVYVPDGTNITIVMDDPINTNLESVYSNNKNTIFVGMMYLIQPVLIILAAFFIIRYAYEVNKKRRY